MPAAASSGGKLRSGALGCRTSPRRLLTKAESRAHIATVRSADWTRAVLSLTPGSARLLGFLSTWQHCHVFFAPLKNSAVFRQLERKEQ